MATFLEAAKNGQMGEVKRMIEENIANFEFRDPVFFFLGFPS